MKNTILLLGQKKLLVVIRNGNHLSELIKEQMDRRINLAYRARRLVTSEWGKGYWDAVLSYLLRQANRLN